MKRNRAQTPSDRRRERTFRVALGWIMLATGSADAAGATIPGMSPAAGAAVTQTASPFQYGSIVLRPGITYQYSHTSGLLVSPGEVESAEQHSVAAGLDVTVGRRWSLGYLATQSYYTTDAFRDTLSHALNFSGAVKVGTWMAQFEQTYMNSSASSLETGRQTRQASATTGVGLAHAFTSALSFSSAIAQDFRFIEAAPDTYQWSATNGFSYAVSSGLMTFTGLNAGYLAAAKTADMIFAQPQASLTWNPSKRLTLSTEVGYESRFLLSRARGEIHSLVFGVSGRYQPFDATTIRTSAGRGLVPSLLRNQTSRTTSVTLTAEQRLLGRFFLSGSYAYRQMDFLATDAEFERRRRDYTESFDAGLRTTLRQKVTLSIGYAETRNDSSGEGFDLTNRQILFSAGFSY